MRFMVILLGDRKPLIEPTELRVLDQIHSIAMVSSRVIRLYGLVNGGILEQIQLPDYGYYYSTVFQSHYLKCIGSKIGHIKNDLRHNM